MNKLDLTFTLENIDEAAEKFLQLADKDKKFALYGNMGAGKTTFITALCKKLEVLDLVSSPTFAIVNEYETKSGDPVFHFDFYRIKETTELFDIGFEEYVDRVGWCFVEWPEKAEDVISDEFVRIEIVAKEDGSRSIKFKV